MSIQAQIIGLSLVVSITVTQVSSAQLAGHFAEDHFYGQFFQTYCVLSSLCLSILPYLFLRIYHPKRAIETTIRQDNIWIKAVFFSMLASLSNFCYQKSLIFLAPSIASAILSTSPSYVYLLQIFLIGFKSQRDQLLATIVSILGNILIIFSKGVDEASNNYFLGILLAFICALTSAFYQVAVVRYVQAQNIQKVFIFLGCLGITELILGQAIVQIFIHTGFENIDFNYIQNNILIFIVYVVLGFLFNFLLNIGCFITNPLYVSIGLLLGLPANLAYDYLVRHKNITILQFFGILMILGAFFVLTINLQLKQDQQKQNDSSHEKKRLLIQTDDESTKAPL